MRWITYPVLGAHAGGHHGYLAGTDDQRLADLNGALRDPSIDAVWCIRGGYGVTRILDRVDFEALASRPRAILGYSDITALLAAVDPPRRASSPSTRPPPAPRCRGSAAGISRGCSPRPSRRACWSRCLRRRTY